MYIYLAIAVFAAVALAIPGAMLLVSLLIRPKEGTELQKEPWESGEETIGQRVDLLHQYLPYFNSFLMLELLAASIILLGIGGVSGMALVFIIGLVVLGMALSWVLLAIAKRRAGGAK